MRRIKSTLRQLRRSPYQAVAVLTVMTFTMLVLSVFVVLTLGANKILHFIESRPQLSAYFDQSITPTDEQVKKIGDVLRSTGHVTSLKYITKEEAYSIYKEFNKRDPAVLEYVNPSALPASIEISAVSPQYIGELSELVGRQDGIKQVAFQKDVVDRLVAWTNTIRIAGSIVVAILASTSILIVVMVTGMRIAIRREEVRIMQLVGASGWYIRWPFLLEGILYGMVSATIAVFITSGVLLWFSPQLAGFFGDFQIVPIPLTFLFGLWGGIMLFGILIGVTGASIAVWRYLKT